MAQEGGLVLKSAILLAKTETTIGTDSVPTVSANAIVAYDVTMDPLGNAESFERRPIAGDAFLGRQTPVPGKRHATASFSIPLAGTGNLASSAVGIPEWSALIKACAWSETFTAGTSVVYGDQATTAPCSIYFIVGPAQSSVTARWKRYKMLGCAGNMTITAENGQPAMLNFEVVGTYEEPVDIADPGDPTLIEIVPPPFLSTGFNFATAWSSYSPCINGIEYDPGNVTVMRECTNQASGYKAGIITDRDPTLTFQMEEDLAANVNMWNEYTTGTACAVSTGTIGSAAGNRYSLAWNRVGLKALSMAERDGILAIDVEGTAAIDVSDLATSACTVTIT